MIRRLSALANHVLLCGGCIGAVLGLGLAGDAPAAQYTEVDNATRFFGGVIAPQDVGPGIDAIRGFSTSGDQGDLYKLVFDIGGTLVIRTRETTIGTSLVPAVFVFDASGAGLGADTAGVAVPALIELTIVPGIYYIGVGDFPLQAIDTDGTVWPAPFLQGGPPADFGTLDRLDFTGALGVVSLGNYRIELSIPTAGVALDVPEPAGLGLLVVGLVGLAAMGHRKASPGFVGAKISPVAL